MSDHPDDYPDINNPAILNLIRIGGKDLVLQIIALYRKHMPQKIERLSVFAQSGFAPDTLEETERLAHSIKSSAGNLGLSEVLTGALHLEKAAASDSSSQCLSAFEELDTASKDAEHVLVTLEKQLQP